MPLLVDTGVAILMRDDSVLVRDFLRGLDPPAYLSAITRIELENGVYRHPAWTAVRRSALDLILRNMPTLEFGGPEIAAYRKVVATVGYSKRKTLDRMIAATALVHGLTLVTVNGRDFADVPGLDLEVWPAP